MKKVGRFFIGFLIFAIFVIFAGGRYIYSSGKQIEKNDHEPEITLKSETKLSNTMTKDPNLSTEEPDKVLIEGVPHIQQLPELPRGCEVTSLAMIMQYAGVSIDKMSLAEEITTVPFRDQNGVRGNPNDGFVGNMYTFEKSGYGVYHSPVAKLAEKYLPGRIVDLTGQGIESVYKMVKSGSPVWVITNATFAPLPEEEFSVWDTATGKVRITYREHSVAIVGYDEQFMYLNDPLADKPYTQVPKNLFEEAWVQMGSQAVSYK